MTEPRTLALVEDLRRLPAETPWIEFKENNTDAHVIGKLLSALANAARLTDQPCAYVLWGVRDADHAAVGTTFEPACRLQQGQPLELWLAQRLQPAIAFQFKSVDVAGTRLVLLEVPAASHSPVEFERQAYVRIGSATPRLSDHPERLKALWAKLQPHVEGEAVRAVLYAPRRFADMTPQERVRACYQHAALKYVSGQRMKNASLRERLGIDPQNAAQTSGVIRQTLQADLIRPADPAHPRAGYVPFWA